jgi:ankyrin repeat protein
VWERLKFFNSFLSLIPESANKTQLMEYFFINCGALNHVEIAAFLLNNNIDIDTCYSRESVEVLYALAVGKDHKNNVFIKAPEVIKNLYLLLAEPHSSRDTTEVLFQKAAKGNMDKNEGVPQGRGITALHKSCYIGEKCNKIRLFLLKNNANPNTMQRDSLTPLMTALFRGYASSALQILDFNPNVNLKAINDITVSSIAAKLGFDRVIRKIINLQGDLDTKISRSFYMTNNKGEKFQFYEGDSPLSIALKDGHISIVEALIDAKVKLNDQIFEENFKGSILAYCIAKHPHLVEKLLANGADVNKEAMSKSPLMLAAELSNARTRLTNQGPEAFVEAQKYDEYKIFEMLLVYGADINFTDEDGDTVIEYTKQLGIESKHFKMIRQIDQHEKAYGIDLQARYKIISDLGVTLNKLPFISQDTNADMVRTSIDIQASFKSNFIQSSESYGFKTPVQKVIDLIVPIKFNIESSYIEPSSAVPALTDTNDLKSLTIVKTQSSDNAKSNVNLFYQAILGIKILDTSIDMFKAFQEPTFQHLNILVRDVTHLSISIAGIKSYSISFSITDTAAQLYYGEYAQAFIQAGTTAAYTLLSALPAILPDVLGVPLAPVYQALYISYISEKAVNILNKIDSTISAYGTPEAKLKSNIAYAELSNFFGFQELAKDYFFGAIKIVEEDFALHQNHESIIQQLAVEHDLLGNLCKLNVVEYDHCNA